MKRLHLQLAALLLLAAILSAGQCPAGPTGPEPNGPASTPSLPKWTCRIVKVYPHDPDAFTQGLVYSEGFFYESTGLHGKSSIRKVDPETGKVLQVHALPYSYFGEGLTRWKDTLIQLTWQSGTAFVYDAESFRELKRFSYQTEGWGITNDGESLIMSDGTQTLRFLDPETFEERRSIEVVLPDGRPLVNLNELEYIRGEIFANVWQSDFIVRISPGTGRVLGWIDLSDLKEALGPVRQIDVLNGIAYDAEHGRIFVTGKLWPKIFEVELATAP